MVNKITQAEIRRRLEHLDLMNDMNKYAGCEGQTIWSAIYPKTNMARIYLVKNDELYNNLYSVYSIIMSSRR